VALSPIPIVAVVLMLSTPRARTNGPAFAVGWVLGLAAVSSIILVLAHGGSTDGAADDTINWLKLALGIAFLVMSHSQWRKRPLPGEEVEMPEWMSMIDAFTPQRSLLLGLALSGANPKNLALTAAAAASIAQQDVSTGDTAIAVAVFIAIASVTVVGAVLYHLVAPASASRTLASVKDFMSVHNAVIMAVVLVLLGAKLLGDGIAG